jgi:transposase-like protein
MKTSKSYSPEVRERAVRMVFEHGGAHASQWAAIASSTYRDRVAKRADPTKLSAPAKRDEALRPQIRRVFQENFEFMVRARSDGSWGAR